MTTMKKIESEFICPDFINDLYGAMKRMGYLTTKATLFQSALKAGLIHEDGTPTEKAYREGIAEETDLIINRFKADHQELQGFDNRHFKVDPVTGGVMVDPYVAAMLALDVLQDPDSTAADRKRARATIDAIAQEEQ